MLSETDPLEARGNALGRQEETNQAPTSSAQPALRVKKEALTLHASPAACMNLLESERVAPRIARHARANPS